MKIPSWLWWGLGLVLGFVLLVGILFPVFVSSSVIKDRIESEFAKNTTGELSLASAKISAWGGLKIKLTDIKVTDANKREALNAKKAAVSIPFLAIFGMGSKVKLGITEPKILVVQNAGETNWQKLMQRETSGPQGSESPPPAPAKDAAPKDNKSMGGAFWLAPMFNAKMDVSLDNADLEFLSSGESTNIKGLNAFIGNVGLNSTIELIVSGQLERKAKEEKSSGGFRVDGHMATSMGSPKSFDLFVDLKQMALSYGTQFAKKKSVPLGFKVEGKFGKSGSIQEIIYEALSFELGENTFKATGKTTLGKSMRTGISAANQKLVLTGLGEMVPSMEAMGGEVVIKTFGFTLNGSAIDMRAVGSIPSAEFHLQDTPKPVKVTGGSFDLKHSSSTKVKANVQVFGGKAKVDTTMTPSGKNMQAQFKYSIENLSMDQATEIFMQDFARTMSGNVHSLGSGKVVLGEKLNPLKTTEMTGKFNVTSAVVRTIDLSKVALESQKSLGRIMSALKAGNKIEKKLSGADSEYESVAGTYSLKNGLFVSDDLYAKALPEKGIDLRGKTIVNLIDKKIKADWMVEDRYDKLGLLDKLSGIKQTALADLLKNAEGVVSFPLTAGCVFDKPCFSLKRAEAFFKSRFKGNLKSNLKKEASGVIKGLIKGDGKKELKDKAKNLLKGLGF